MEETISLLYPAGYKKNKDDGLKNYDFIESLKISDLIVLADGSFRGLSDLKLSDFFTTNTSVLQYRLDVVKDLVENDRLYQTFQNAVNMICDISDLKKAFSPDYTTESALSSVRYLEIYQELITLFYQPLKACEVTSLGMRTLKEKVLYIAESEDFINLSKGLKEMQVHFSSIKSVTIGLNLDENLRPIESGVISVNTTYFHAGSIMDKLLKKTGHSDAMMSSLYPLGRGLPREELLSVNCSMKQALTHIFSKALRDFEPMIQRYYSVQTSLFISLLDEIRFLVAGVRFIRSMQDMGFTMCCPKIAELEEKRCELNQVYNPVLARTLIEKMIVSNSFQFDENGMFYLLTGPNHGGKSIFAESVGIAQALFQLGLYVPAKSACMSPATGIFTHFPVSDENNYGKGRLESECERMGEIMKAVTENDMLLMDESFSSTSGLEASYIASDVLTGIGMIGCRGIFVTHIHDLSQKLDQYNSHPQNKGKIDNLVALMEDKENGIRNYKISRTTPDGLSYARNIAQRYGLDLDCIMKERESVTV